MWLTFKTVDQVIFKLDVDPAERIKSLKERIQNDKGGEYHAEGMKLLFAGKILDDEKTIGDYSINDKGFIVIVVPRPKTPGKESGKKSRSSHPQFPGISTILENALYSNADPTDPTIPVDYTQWRDRDRYPQSGNSSDYETSAVESHGKVIRSRVSSDSGQPGRSSKRHSYRNSTASESSIRAAMMREVSRGGVVSPEAASSATNEVPPLESYNTMDEMPKNAEVSNWLERHVEAPVPVVERSLSIDETVNENVRKIVAMGFEREDAEVALNASFNSVEGAVEYLCRPASAQPEARVPAFAYIPPVVQRFPSVVRSRTDLDDPLEFLKTNEAFQLLRLEVQRNPDLLPSALEGFRSSHSDLEPIFQAFEDRLVELLTEPLDDSPSLVSSTVVMDTSNVVMDTEQSPVTNLSTLELKENEILVDPSQHHMIMMSPKSLDRLDPVRSSSSDTDLLLLDPVRSSSSDTDQLLLDPARSSSSDMDQLLLDPARSSLSDKDQLLLDPVRSSSSDADELLVDPARSSLSDKEQLLLNRLDPVQSSSADTDRLLDLPIASDDSTSSSPVPSSIERRVPPVGEDMSGIEALPEDVGSELLGEEDEEKLSEELIRALLLQDQEEEEERVEAERRAAGAAEAISWNDAESLESSISGGVRGIAGGGGGGRGGRGGGRTLEDRGYVRVTMEEKQAIDRLKSLGFSEERVVQVYLACEKNEEMAANILLDKD